MINAALWCLILAAPASGKPAKSAAPSKAPAAAAVDAAAAVPAAPKVRTLNRDLGGGLSASIRIQPGVPKAGDVTRVIVELARSGPTGPVPLNGASLTAMIRPDVKGTKDRKLRRALGRVRPIGRVVHALKDRGSYGFHVTLPKSGSYQVQLQGELGANPIAIDFGLHPDLWPAPDLETEAAQVSSGRSRRPLRRR